MQDPYPPLLVRVREHLPHLAQNLGLLALSLAFFWVDLALLLRHVVPQALREMQPRLGLPPAPIMRRWYNHLGVLVLRDGRSVRHRRATSPPKTILIAGANTARGLALARDFYVAGHNVVAADCEPAWWLPVSPARVSRVVQRFYLLPPVDGGEDDLLAYADAICRIARTEGVDLFIPCGAETDEEHEANALAKELLDRRLPGKCHSVQLNKIMTCRLQNRDELRDYVKSIDLPFLHSEPVASAEAVVHYLEADSGRHKYALLPSDTKEFPVSKHVVTLPLKYKDHLHAYLNQYRFSGEPSYRLQQHVSGPTFSTHALVVNGKVRTFVALNAESDGMHLQQLSPDSGLSISMLRYTQEFAAASQQILRSSQSNFTGHLSFTFVVDREDAEAAMRDPALIVKLYAIDCTPGMTNAAIMFDDPTDAYLSVLASQNGEARSLEQKFATNGTTSSPLRPAAATDATFYWLLHDLFTLVFIPLLAIARPMGFWNVSDMYNSASKFFSRPGSQWYDCSVVTWDPLPAFWLYHVYLPVAFCSALLTGRRWEKLDVSTCRIHGNQAQVSGWPNI